MAAQNYYTGDASLPPHPQLQGPAPPPYTELASPRPQPAPNQPYARIASPYRPSQQQQQSYPPRQQQQQPPPQGPQQQGYRPSQHYYQPHAAQQYPPQQQPLQVKAFSNPVAHQLPLRSTDAYYPRPSQSQAHSSCYPQPKPYPPGMQRPQTFAQQSQQNLHPQHAYNSPLGQQQNGFRPSPHHRPSYDDLADKPSHQHHHHHHTKRRSKSDTGRDTFLGAGGGAILGDVLIGPGVGTLGAAILGGLAGNKHAKDKERKRRSGSGRRSTSRDSRDGRN